MCGIVDFLQNTGIREEKSDWNGFCLLDGVVWGAVGW